MSPGSLANEATAYAWLWANDPTRAADYVPQVACYDSDQDILVTQLSAQAGDLTRYHQRLGRFPKEVGSQIGRALAWVHMQPSQDTSEGVVAEGPAWILGLHVPTLDLYRELSAANIQLVKIIQSVPDLCEGLDRLHSSWRGAHLIHNDVKWDNILVLPPGTGSRGRIRLIDWELATRGDPSWDVGGALAAYVGAWLLSIPLTRETGLEELANMARSPLAKSWPAMRGLWASYKAAAGLSESESPDFLVRSIQYVAARLLQTAYETSQLSWELSAHASLLVQVSTNILRRPADAATYLLGLN
jgi:predicted trehalose synthase